MGALLYAISSLPHKDRQQFLSHKTEKFIILARINVLNSETSYFNPFVLQYLLKVKI